MDYNKAIIIAPHVYWVGAFIPGDSFQSHAYLIEDGDQSILIDPGSPLTWEETAKKISQILPFGQIKYFLFHHQDPDIAAIIPRLDKIITRKDAQYISHWRTNALLKHYQPRIPLKCVEKMGWTLPTSYGDLQFIFTPYMHFAGAFCTYFPKAEILFSSDIFGSIDHQWELFINSLNHLDGALLFHEHYMPSQEIAVFTLQKFRKLSVKWILPQHGSIIPEEYISYYLNQLEKSECGLFKLTQTSTDLEHLQGLTKLLKEFTQTLTLQKNFDAMAKEFLLEIRQVLPIGKILFFCQDTTDRFLQLSETSRFRAVETIPPEKMIATIKTPLVEWLEAFPRGFRFEEDKDIPDSHNLCIPLCQGEENLIYGFLQVNIPDDIAMTEETLKVLLQISTPLSVALQRELLFRYLEEERQKFYQLSITDPLTGLYNRSYLGDTIKRLLHLHDRSPGEGFSMVIFDIDHFKGVNDKHGHKVGDIVLKKVAHCITETIRVSDIAIRLGGEEFGVFMPGTLAEEAFQVAERIRIAVKDLDFPGDAPSLRVTISGGISQRSSEEGLESLMHKADQGLYKSKSAGRNQNSIH